MSASSSAAVPFADAASAAAEATVAADPIPYATPAPKPASRGWAAAAIVFGGLGLMLTAGCFLIGALSIVHPNLAFVGNGTSPPLTGAQTLLLTVLYACAFASFAGGGAMLTVGTRALLRIAAV